MGHPRQIVLALLLVAVVLGLPFVAVAERVKISSSNIGTFKELTHRSPRFVCFRTRLGWIEKGQVVAGGVWQSFELNRQQSSLTSLTKKLKRSRGSAKASLKAQIKVVRARIKAGGSLLGRCPGGATTPPNTDSFKGDPESLSPYRNSLTESEVQHLLDKVAFGGSQELKEIGKNQGREALVNALVDGVMTDAERRAFDNDAMSRAADHFYYNTDTPGYADVRIWTTWAAQVGQLYRSITTREPLREWMLLQLSHHYAVNLSRIGFSYDLFGHFGIELHWKLLKDTALGDFRSITKALIRDPAMNFWLGNKDNHIDEPNQNFARELLELFLLGAADPVSHVANYDERSIVAATAFVSGFLQSTQSDPLSGKDVVDITYVPALHDAAPYTLFPGTAGAEVRRSLTAEGLVDQILDKHPGSARYLSERFGGLMLYPGLSESVVSQLAAALRSNNFQIKPFLKLVLNSEAMFSTKSIDPCVTSPIEQEIRLLRKLGPELAKGQATDWLFYGMVSGTASSGQSLFEPPSVFGWKGSCNINRSGMVSSGEGWLSAQRLLSRSRTCLDAMNALNEMRFDFVRSFGLTKGMSAEEVLSKVATTFSDRTLNDAERSVLLKILTTEFNEDGSTYSTPPRLDEEWYVRRKLPRLTCLIHDLVASNRR